MHMTVTLDSIVEGKVTRITAFGAFVDLGGCSGLIHISEIADAYVRDVNEYLHVGDIVKVKVVSVEPPGKIGLSLKQAQEKPAEPARPRPAERARQAERPRPAQPEQPQTEASIFEDKLARFMKDSNEKLVALKRHQEGRKGH